MIAQLSQRESDIFGLLQKKQGVRVSFSEREEQVFSLLQKKSKSKESIATSDLSLDEQRRSLGIPTGKDIPPQPIPLREFTFGSSKIPRLATEAPEPSLDEKRLAMGIPIQKDKPPETAGQVVLEAFRPTFAYATAPVTVPLNILDGLIDDFTGGSSVKNLNAIRRIAAGNPAEGDELFVGEFLKRRGLTDETLKLPEGTIDRIGLIADFPAFGGAGKLQKLLLKTMASKFPAKTIVNELEVILSDVPIRAARSRASKTALEKSMRRQEELLHQKFTEPVLKSIKRHKEKLAKEGVETVRPQQIGIKALEKGRQGVGRIEPEIARQGVPQTFEDFMKATVGKAGIARQGKPVKIPSAKPVTIEALGINTIEQIRKDKLVPGLAGKILQDIKGVYNPTEVKFTAEHVLRNPNRFGLSLRNKAQKILGGQGEATLVKSFDEVADALRDTPLGQRLFTREQRNRFLVEAKGRTKAEREAGLAKIKEKPTQAKLFKNRIEEAARGTGKPFKPIINTGRQLFKNTIVEKGVGTGKEFKLFRPDIIQEEARLIREEIQQAVHGENLITKDAFGVITNIQKGGIKSTFPPYYQSLSKTSSKKTILNALKTIESGDFTTTNKTIQKVRKLIDDRLERNTKRYTPGTGIEDPYRVNDLQIKQRMTAEDLAFDDLLDFFGSKNKLVTKTDLDSALKSANTKLNDLKLGIDITALKDITKVGMFYIEGGIRSFAEWSKIMITHFGDRVKSSLRKIWAIDNADFLKSFKGKPLTPLGVKAFDLVKTRIFDIDKAFLDSEHFIRQFDNLPIIQREALVLLRQGVKDVNVLKKIGRKDLIDIIKNPPKELKPFLDKLTSYYDNSFLFLQKEYDGVGFVKNYVTQIWDIPNSRKGEVLNYFSTHNPFTKKRTIPSYEEGIKLGLIPKTLDVSELLRIYDQYVIKTVFNMRFAKGLKEITDFETGKGIIMNMKAAPADWIKYDHFALNKIMGNPHMPVMINPEISKEIKAIFDTRFSHPIITALEIINAFQKKGQLSLSFFHPFALAESAFSNNIGIKSLSLFNPFKIKRALLNKDFEIYKQMPLAKDSIDHGVRYGSLPDYHISTIRNALVNMERFTRKIPVVGQGAKIIRTANDLWDRGLWDYMHNTLKLWAYEKQVILALKYGNKITQKQLGRNMTRAEIESSKNLIGSFINDSFGGQRWELQRAFRDPKMQQMMQWGLLSPDWTLSTLKQAAAPLKGHLILRTSKSAEEKLAGRLLRKRATMFWLKAGLYFNLIAQSVNLLNTKLFEGNAKFTWENDPGHKLNMFVGFNEDGTKRYLRMGKQFREVLEWGIEPDKRLGAKVSPAMAEIIRQLGKHTPGSGFPTEFAEMEFYESIPTRLKSIGLTGIPFSLRSYITGSPKNFLFTLPASKGMTNYKTVDLFKKAIRKNDINRAAEVYFAALENRLDAGQLFKNALSSIKTDMRMDDKEIAKRIIGELRILNDSQAQKDLYNHYKQRGIITPGIEKIFRDISKREKRISRQRKVIGIKK